MAKEKLKLLQRRLVIDMAIFSALATVLFTIYFFVSGYRNDLDTQQNKLKAEINSTNTKVQNLEKQFQKAKQYVSLYEQLTRGNQNKDMGLNRKNASAVLNELKERYKLSGLSMKMTPVEAMKGDMFHKKTMKVVYTSVSLKFSGLTDEYLLSFVDAVTAEFAGYVRVNDLSLKRDRPITNETLAAVSQGQVPPLVSGEMTFYWLGLQEIAAEEQKEAPAKGKRRG